MLDQDHGPQPKRAVKVSPNGPPRFSLPVQKATSECPETPGKSRRSNDPREHFITALRGAFVSNDTGHWPGVKLVAMARLTVPERAALAFSALRALPRDVREMTSLAAHEYAGAPIAPLFSYMSEAELWVEFAAPAEKDAYALACFKAMEPARQKAFIEYISGVGSDVA